MLRTSSFYTFYHIFVVKKRIFTFFTPLPFFPFFSLFSLVSFAKTETSVDMFNTSVTKGQSESHGQNFQKLGRELLTVDEIGVMDGAKCILQIRGERPFFSKKYDLEKHPNYRYLADHDPKNTFDVDKHLSTKLKIRKDDVYVVAEIDMTAESAPQAE